MLVCVFLCALCTRDRGCSAHPAFPAPSSRENVFAKLGQIVPREGEAMSVATSPAVIARLDRATQYAAPSRLKILLSLEIGIGGSLAAPPLPHHRTYGSVYGGSTD